MIVTELAELLSKSGRFLYPRTPAGADQSKVGLHCAGWYRGRGSKEMSAYRGVGVYEKNISSRSSASCLIFS